MTDEMLNALREIVRSEIDALHNAHALSPSLAVQPVEALRAKLKPGRGRDYPQAGRVQPVEALRAEIARLNARINVLRASNQNAVDENSMLHAQVQAQTQRTEVERARAERTRIELVQAQRTIDALRADLVKVWRMYNTREHKND